MRSLITSSVGSGLAMVALLAVCSLALLAAFALLDQICKRRLDRHDRNCKEALRRLRNADISARVIREWRERDAREREGQLIDEEYARYFGGRGVL